MIKSIYPLWSFVLVILLTNILACSKDEVIDVSACIESRIENDTIWACPNSSIKEYKFQHRPVFVFATLLCHADGGADVLDINCNEIGFLWGFGGNHKVDGIDFFENAKFIRNIWHN